MINRRTFMGTGLAAFASANLLPRQARAAGEEMIYVSIGNGADTNPGTKQSPLKTLSAVANDLDYRNNIVSNSLYVWIGQGARSAQAEMDQIGRGRAGGPPAGGPPSGGPPPNRPPAGPGPPESRYNVRNCLFAGNKKLTGSGAGVPGTGYSTSKLRAMAPALRGH